LNEPEIQEPLDEWYVRSLDSLARFYNSQATVHVGYVLTLIAISFALFAFVNQRLSLQLPWQQYVRLVFVTWAVIGASLYYPFKYAVARLQYYLAWSEIVWMHMGLQGHGRDWLDAMEWRARRIRDNRGGIQPSIRSMFEARIYVSQCYRRGDMSKEKEKKILDNLREFFEFDEDISDEQLRKMMIRRHYPGRILFWDRIDLLGFAYVPMLLEYRGGGEHDAKIESLLRDGYPWWLAWCLDTINWTGKRAQPNQNEKATN
jgi:hypothetical protein